MRVKISAVLLAGALSACASGPKPPPEPDMTQLINVNDRVPSEVQGRYQPSGTKQQGER